MASEPVIAGRSDVGRVRQHNEDSIGFHAPSGVAVLADGMGGLYGGEVASRIAVDRILNFLRANPAIDEPTLIDAVRAANSDICSHASRDVDGPMGTTVVIWVGGEMGQCFVCHVGDSRAYRLRGSELLKLTDDHSVVQQMLSSGEISEAEARVAPNRNVITRAVGLSEAVEVDVRSCVHVPGDVFLLCSDGLTDMLDDASMSEVLAEHLTPQGAGDLDAAAKSLVEAANVAGGVDNVSVVLIRTD